MNQTGADHQSIKKISHYSYSSADFIGKGNFSRVYKAFNTRTKQNVAIKVVELDKLEHKNLQAFIFQEINILKKMNHPNIIKFHQAIVSERTCYIVTELCKEGNLEEISKKKKGFSPSELAELIRDVYQGLKYLREAGVCHRDIKAANIFMKSGKAKIGDFGLAKRYKEEFKDMDVGSPLFMAPEGIIYNTYGQKTDIWAFGIFIYELIHGASPFIGCRTNNQLQKAVSSPIPECKFSTHIPPELRELINLLLTIDEHNRPTIEKLQQNSYIKSCLARPHKKATSGLMVVQRSRMLSHRVKSQAEDTTNKEEIRQEGKIQLMGDSPKKQIAIGRQNSRNSDIPKFQFFKSHQFQNQRPRIDRPPRPPQASKTNRNGFSTMKGIPKFNALDAVKGFQEGKFRKNSTKTVETKDQEEDSYLRKREYQVPFFHK